jgi:hypothetical protein
MKGMKSKNPTRTVELAGVELRPLQLLDFRPQPQQL